MAKKIMIQGTMSNVGKSVITAGLCRIFHQDGYRVAPFKSQNMALNSYVTKEGFEMGRAQVIPDIMNAFQKLEEEYDIIVIEGAGSPAEINLKSDDIVNMGLAKLLNAPVLLVGDIDRGGVFDSKGIATTLVNALAKRKGIEGKVSSVYSYQEYKEQQYDKLAKGIRDSIDLEHIYRIMHN